MNFKLPVHVILVTFALFSSGPAQANPEEPGLACLDLPAVENSRDEQSFDAMLQVHNEALKVGNTDLAFRSGCHSYFLGIETSGVSKQALADLAVAIARLQYERYEDESSLEWYVRALSHERRPNGKYNASAFRPLVQAASLAIQLGEFKRAAEYVAALSKNGKRGFKISDVERAEILALKGRLQFFQVDNKKISLTRDLQVSSAKKSFSAAAAIYTKQDLSIEATEMLLEIGELEALAGNLDKSLETFTRARDAFIADGLSESDLRIIRARSGILQVYGQMGQGEKVEALRKRVLEYYGQGEKLTVSRTRTDPPAYPFWAALRGIEGWILVGFEISESGHVLNSVVLDSSPAFTFNKTAITTLRRWKYAASTEAKGIRKIRTAVVLTFELED